MTNFITVTSDILSHQQGYNWGARFRATKCSKSFDGTFYPSDDYRSGFGKTKEEAQANVSPLTDWDYSQIEKGESQLGC